jgi:hypothetical protein
MYSLKSPYSSAFYRACLGWTFLEGYRDVETLLKQVKGTLTDLKPEELEKIYEGYTVARDAGYPASQEEFINDCETHFTKLAAKQQNALEVGYTTYKTSINEAKKEYSQTENNLKKEFGAFKEQYEAKQEANKKAYEGKLVESYTNGIYAANDAGLDDFYDHNELKTTWEDRYISENETKAIDKVPT